MYDAEFSFEKDKVVVDLTGPMKEAAELYRLALQRATREEIAAFAAANGYVKLEPGQCVVQAHPFTEEEVDYLLDAIEPMKCADCKASCGIGGSGRCLFMSIRAKLNAIQEAENE